MTQEMVTGSIIRLKPEYEERYKSLHRNTFPGVLDRISRSNITRYSIFLNDGMLFSQMIYNGNDYISDMTEMGKDQVTRDWWLLTDPMQEPVAGHLEGEWWAGLGTLLTLGREVTGPGRRIAWITGYNAHSVGLIQNLSGQYADGLTGDPFTLRIFAGYGNIFITLEIQDQNPEDPATLFPGLAQLTAISQPMEEVFFTFTNHNGDSPRKKVAVSGCFDMLHSGHVAFLQEAAGFGDLYVLIGSDSTIAGLKNRHTVNTEEERKYMLDALACVHRCIVSRGSGYLDFADELREIRPDYFVVNEEGHSIEKEALCGELQIEYKVLRRIPHTGLPARSTTGLRQVCTIPFRIDLAGGWLDQPYVSKHYPGPVLTVSIEPTTEFNNRSGMASSTRNKAIELWRTALPHGGSEHLAKVLFSFENPPGTKIIAGSQDSLGIVLPGLNHLYYSGNYWPDRITSCHDESVLTWLEQHLCLVTLGPRVSQYDVLAGTDITPEKARNLAEATDDCWNAIIARDVIAFGDAFRRSFEAQVAMFPNMAGPEIYEIIGKYKDQAAGWKLSGAGGGGYLILVTDQPVKDSIRIKIRRKANL